jgi:hypothetical protein
MGEVEEDRGASPGLRRVALSCRARCAGAAPVPASCRTDREDRTQLDDATAAAHLRANCRKYSARALIRRTGADCCGLQGRHCLFRCAPRERPAHSPRSGTTKKDFLRSKPRIKACSSSSGTRQGSRLRCIRLGARARFAEPRWRSRKVLAANSLQRIRPACTQGQPQTAVTGLRSPVVWGAVIVVQLAFPVTIVPIVGTIARESWRAAQLLLGDIRPVPA